MRKTIFSARKKDFRIDRFRAGGKGGQNQNKRDTGVRITHIATGISAESREHREQARNHASAFRKLCDRLIAHFVDQDDQKRFAAGDETVRSYHEPNDRVTDHADGRTFSYKHTVGKGDLAELIEHRRDVKGGQS